MKKIEISKEDARKFLINYHGLNGGNTYVGEKGILEYINKVGCIQYDPLNVVGRNADLVLQSRIKDYRPSMLEKLLYEKRSLVDGWDKMMSIYKLEDWSFFHRIRQCNEEQIKTVLKSRDSIDALDLTEEIRAILLQEGPMQASKISIGQGGKGRWGHRKLSSAALDYMYNRGELGIHSKKNTQKIYDIIENLLPEEILNNTDPFKSDNEFYKWYVTRRVGSVGLLWARSGGGWLGYAISNKKLRNKIIDELVEENILIEVKIAGIDETFYVRAEDTSILDSANEKENMVVNFLAPLDNLLWDRAMTEKIFDFNYRWEVYTPKAKRKYGYYVLPVLYGNSLVGRVEMEMQRKTNPLEIKNWWWEDGVIVSNEMENAIRHKLDDFCGYLQADGVIEDSLNTVFK